MVRDEMDYSTQRTSDATIARGLELPFRTSPTLTFIVSCRLLPGFQVTLGRDVGAWNRFCLTVADCWFW